MRETTRTPIPPFRAAASLWSLARSPLEERIHEIVAPVAPEADDSPVVLSDSCDVEHWCSDE